MEQKSNIESRIISILEGKELHIRGLSKLTNVNHTTIKRIVDNLYRDNCVDFQTLGKNKVFFLKKNLESREKIIVMELSKQQEALKKYLPLREIFEKIIINKQIRLALLFGSYAKGLAKGSSDMDIYLETEDQSLKKEIEKINSSISIKIGPFDKENLLIKEIIKNHVVIKGLEAYYEKTH